MENIVGEMTFEVHTTNTGDVYINNHYYKQLCFTPNQIALALEDYLNGKPADNEDYDEVNYG